ncbi:MAG: hypothetical protein WA210_08520, partial [Burkholderiaceae bacterium]
HDWRVSTEAALSESALRGAGRERVERVSIDVHVDKALGAGWRAVFADRLDARRQPDPGARDNVNTLKEAYLSWQAAPDVIADLGRVNVRHGSAYGYNPTDYFRAGALRSVTSIDPASLRENRLGSVMLRGQVLWTDGSLSALYSPKLADQPSAGEFSADLGATNRRDRWLVAASHKISDRLNPQALLYGAAGEPVQLGLNLSALLNDATVAHLEWSGGRSASLLAQALALQDGSAFRSRLSTGLTYTAPNKLSLTVELQANGAGLASAEWDALRSAAPAAYGRYRGFVADLQDPPTRQRVFLRAHWEDAFMNHLDLTGMSYFDAVDSSRLFLVEARYHWPRVDVALLWQLNSGQPGSSYGGLPQRRIWQALAKYFF